jgi:hypothetical protein
MTEQMDVVERICSPFTLPLASVLAIEKDDAFIFFFISIIPIAMMRYGSAICMRGCSRVFTTAGWFL